MSNVDYIKKKLTEIETNFNAMKMLLDDIDAELQACKYYVTYLNDDIEDING